MSPDCAAPTAGPTAVRTSSSDDGPAGLGAGSRSTSRATASGASIAPCSAMLALDECPTQVARSMPISRSSVRAWRAWSAKVRCVSGVELSPYPARRTSHEAHPVEGGLVEDGGEPFAEAAGVQEHDGSARPPLPVAQSGVAHVDDAGGDLACLCHGSDPARRRVAAYP